jgi:hypothetical protein
MTPYRFLMILVNEDNISALRTEQYPIFGGSLRPDVPELGTDFVGRTLSVSPPSEIACLF